jgi:hypothetical protein
LNQIDQWLAWQAHGTRPIPADGWANSAVTFAEDCMPLTTAELEAWLWRIDLSVEIVAQRAAQLSPVQLHWRPTDGEWSLYQVLHHLASAEVFYAVALDEVLPAAAVDRYALASQRLHNRLIAALGAPEEPDMAFYDDEIGLFTPEQIAQQALEQEHRLIHSRSK